MDDPAPGHWAAVRIVVTINKLDPIEGHVTRREEAASTAFGGWLGLIRLLSDAVDSEIRLVADVATPVIPPGRP